MSDVLSDEVTVADNQERKRYEVRVGETLAGILAYTVRDGVVVMPHTVVEPRFEGRGLGGLMAEKALDDARAHGLKVVPSCWFVAAYIEKNPEYADLVVSR